MWPIVIKQFYYLSLERFKFSVFLQLVELCMAFFKSYEVVYFSYLFARVQDKRYYQATSGLARTAMLMGKCGSLVFAQVLVVIYGKDYVKELPCYTLGSEYMCNYMYTSKWFYIMYNVI